MGDKGKKPKILLVRANDRLGRHPFLAETNVTGVYPALGLAYLAAAVRAAGYPVSILEGNAHRLSMEQIKAQAASFNPQIIGLSSTTFNWPLVAETAKAIRSTIPDCLILVGGPQLSLYAAQCLDEPAVDGAVIGEGEQALTEIARALESGHSPVGIAGTMFREKGELVMGPDRLPVQDLDTIPMPALDLLPIRQYRALTLPHPFVTLVTSRGCPFHCRYCSQVYAGGVYREHSAQRVVAEMERAVREFDAKELVFFDETFTMNRKRTLEICRLAMDGGIHTKWDVRTRADVLDDEMLTALADAGCASLHIGIEAGSERVQKLMNKNLNLGKIPPMLKRARQLGIQTRGYFMLGFPGETLEEMDQTIRFARSLPLDWASFTITTPNPGTEIYAQGQAEGRFHGDYWEDYTLGKACEPLGYFTSEQYDEPKLKEYLGKAYKKFYMRPGLIGRKLVSLQMIKQLPGIARTLWELRNA